MIKNIWKRRHATHKRNEYYTKDRDKWYKINKKSICFIFKSYSKSWRIAGSPHLYVSAQVLVNSSFIIQPFKKSTSLFTLKFCCSKPLSADSRMRNSSIVRRKKTKCMHRWIQGKQTHIFRSSSQQNKIADETHGRIFRQNPGDCNRVMEFQNIIVHLPDQSSSLSKFVLQRALFGFSDQREINVKQWHLIEDSFFIILKIYEKSLRENDV